MSDLVASLLYQIRAVGLPEPALEFRFCPARRWRFDMCWKDSKLACELDGGTFSGGRHVRPVGYENDAEKLNEAVLMGYRVLRFTSAMVSDGRAVATIERALS